MLVCLVLLSISGRVMQTESCLFCEGQEKFKKEDKYLLFSKFLAKMYYKYKLAGGAPMKYISRSRDLYETGIVRN